MPKKKIHLVCNAHLDPVWLWPWEDGLTETLSTFRTAADFAEKHENFVFNHNEAILYRWVEEHEPELFHCIQKLVQAGKWHISGGTFLQPDINNVSGESHIRHYLYGLSYFKEKFGARPRTAYNFDSFGQVEGFPQILTGCGMDSYIFCRPDYGTYPLPLGAFRWRDRTGATVIARRSDDFYLSNQGIKEKMDQWLPHFADEPETMILWGIGNHGGGVSRKQYRILQNFIQAHPEYEFIESTPESFFQSVSGIEDKLPVIRGEIQNSFPGCYTSMSRVKRAHREAESLMAATERLCAIAWWTGASSYPAEELKEAWEDILFCEFHDILPGSGVPSVEKDALAQLGHATEILRRLRLRTLLTLLQGEKPAPDEVVPIFVVNPHGFRVKTQIELEYHVSSLSKHNVEIHLRKDGRRQPLQRIKAHHNLDGDWRVRLAVPVNLAPWEICRFDASFVEKSTPPISILPAANRANLRLESPNLTIQINPRTGFVDEIKIPQEKKSLVGKRSFRPILFQDLDHSWTCGDPDQMVSPEQKNTAGCGPQAPPWKTPSAVFRLATREEAAKLSPPPSDKWNRRRKLTTAKALRIVEEGSIRTVVEAIYVCDNSAIIRNYVFGHKDGFFEIRDRIFFNHRDHMLKLEVPLAFKPARSLSETPYSAVVRPPSAQYEDYPNQRWIAVEGDGFCITAANTGSFAHNLTSTSFCLNLMRSPAYSSFNIKPGSRFSDNRFLPRQDQGEHEVAFRFHFGNSFNERLAFELAAVLNIPPHFQVYYPNRMASKTKKAKDFSNVFRVNPGNIQIVALKRAEREDDLIIRLQETAGRTTRAELRFAGFRRRVKTTIKRYAVKTLAVQREKQRLISREVNFVEDL